MLNKAMLIGRLGRDPEVRYTQSGQAVCNFSIATSEKWKGNDGEQHEKTEWHRIVAWKRLAEVCGEYLEKGSLVYIEGKLQTREWADKDGSKRYTTEIVARELKMLSFKKDGKGAPGDEDKGSSSGGPEDSVGGAGDDDQIPF